MAVNTRVGLGFRAQKGGSLVVAVALENGVPHALVSTFLSTAAEGDRASLEPYHLAAEIACGGSAAARVRAEAIVNAGRATQAALAREGLGALLQTVSPGGTIPVIAALLVNRAGWVTDLFEYSLAFEDHPPVAEGLAVREALRAAFAARGLPSVERDEKSLTERASVVLGLPEGDIATRLGEFGKRLGKPWRKEQKAAALAAWMAAAGE